VANALRALRYLYPSPSPSPAPKGKGLGKGMEVLRDIMFIEYKNIMKYAYAY